MKSSCICSVHEIQELAVWFYCSSEVTLSIGSNGQSFMTEINKKLIMDFSKITHFTELIFYEKVWLRYFSKILHVLSQTLYTAWNILFPLALPWSWSHRG